MAPTGLIEGATVRVRKAGELDNPAGFDPTAGGGGGGRGKGGRGKAADGNKGRRQLQKGPGRRRCSVSPSRIFILRPVATSLMMAGVVLVGFVAFRQLPVSALPQVDYPTMQIQTFYPGASPEVVTSSITAPLEKQFGQVPGLTQMTSISSFGSSLITLQFSLDLSIDVAEQEVQAAINAATTFLPTNLPVPPVYSKTNPADAPILTLAHYVLRPCRCPRSRSWRKRAWRREFRSSKASVWSASAADSVRPSGCRPIPPRWRPTA